MNNQEYIENTIEHMKQKFICESIVKGNIKKEFQNYIHYKKIFDDYIGKCQSPIEKMMCAILFQTEVYFEPQEKIGNYTVDFLIQVDENKYIVIECDGHEFHEKTKEQAKHDKERDRFLQKEGYPVYRFTGSEIFNNPLHILSEIEEILYKGGE